jgi:transcriptional regulator with XRE-family HTH domain
MATLSTGNVRQPTGVPPLSSEVENLAFGDFLRQARERRGLTLQDIARETKIPFRHLDALEHGNLSVVPQGIYRRNEIRAFARTVGLDQNVALAELERALKVTPSRPQQSSSLKRPPGRSGRTAVADVAIVLALLAVSALALWTRAAPVPLDVQTPPPAAPTTAPAIPVAPPPPPSTVAASEGSLPEPAPAPLVVPETPPSPVVADGQITIVTDPPGARVTINGVGRGTTPLTVASLPFGSHRIRVTLDGYLGEERIARIEAPRPTSDVQIPLTAIR